MKDRGTSRGEEGEKKRGRRREGKYLEGSEYFIELIPIVMASLTTGVPKDTCFAPVLSTSCAAKSPRSLTRL